MTDMRVVLGMMVGCVACVTFLTATAVGGCGYKMQPVDYTTLQNMAPNCSANVVLLADAGPQYAQERATDRACNCGARGILARAGQPEPDAGKAGCPQ
jgi:hypothetical protein